MPTSSSESETPDPPIMRRSRHKQAGSTLSVRHAHYFTHSHTTLRPPTITDYTHYYLNHLISSRFSPAPHTPPYFPPAKPISSHLISLPLTAPHPRRTPACLLLTPSAAFAKSCRAHRECRACLHACICAVCGVRGCVRANRLGGGVGGAVEWRVLLEGRISVLNNDASYCTDYIGDL
ncbi:hypothetical protein BDV95DRAFT_112055 [Massariosphaeria phaeospora]|uniref:Uncharacterized protein n=1 Tax=Massariosphaeria phaeospora TaxID=100035 RepID=A0A7C8MK51_9PLEO|nr:hypothetical protein BDV95DRAFT_112055 [Massariosphaeria phaeospora]